MSILSLISLDEINKITQKYAEEEDCEFFKHNGDVTHIHFWNNNPEKIEHEVQEFKSIRIDKKRYIPDLNEFLGSQHFFGQNIKQVDIYG